jgi:hypothetical protein
VKVSTATFESAQYILFRHIHINFYVCCIHVGIPMMLVETSLHIVILPDQHDCCCCQVHDIYEGVQTAGITVSAIKSQIKSKPAARVTVRDPGSVLSCADRTRKTHSDPLKQVVWDNWVYRLDGKTWIERMADDNLQEWRLGASGILDEPYVGDREELF